MCLRCRYRGPKHLLQVPTTQLVTLSEARFIGNAIPICSCLYRLPNTLHSCGAVGTKALPELLQYPSINASLSSWLFC